MQNVADSFILSVEDLKNIRSKSSSDIFNIAAAVCHRPPFRRKINVAPNLVQ
jgi:hypothetical protein